MSEKADIYARYESFQKPAVAAIANDFATNPKGRYLLVIPTGGGKTFTAVKAVCRLFDEDTLHVDSDAVLWIAHRTELITQAINTLELFCENNSTAASKYNVSFAMVSSLATELASEKYKLVVIDEAHHSAANSYQVAFQNSSIGILGLTATPSRHDGKPLEFDKESYSIGFPELVKKGIILKPKIISFEGGDYEFDSFEDDDLEQLNNSYRNGLIVQSLLENRDKFSKIIVYVGTKTHAVSLYDLLKESDLSNSYESVSYIVGDTNSRGQSREDFIEEEKRYSSSVLVNVQVLSEGYDDPSINTVVMAAPSKSKLYYMQAIGRAIRNDPNNLAKTAYIVEIDDKLPNIRYRIDNRWLFSDVSDVLEPTVLDVEFSDDLKAKIQAIYEEYSVPAKNRQEVIHHPDDRTSMLLFKQYVSENTYRSFPILINNSNRLVVRNVFNFISERMEKFRSQQVYPELVFQMTGTNILGSATNRQLVFDAMSNASLLLTESKEVSGWIRRGAPWITFVSFNYVQEEDSLDPAFLSFTDGMINRDDIIELVRTGSYEPEAHLLKLPLPLQSFVGKIVTTQEAKSVSYIVDQVLSLKMSLGETDHRQGLKELVGDTVLPIELSYSDSIILIARDELEYVFKID